MIRHRENEYASIHVTVTTANANAHISTYIKRDLTLEKRFWALPALVALPAAT